MHYSNTIFSVPKFLIIISIIQVVLFYADRNEVIISLFDDNTRKRYQVWRLVTHLFVHNDYMHLWGNILCQLLVGRWASQRQQNVEAIYFLSGIGGAILSSTNLAVGCSTALYGMLFAGVADCIINWKALNNRWLHFSISTMATSLASTEAALLLILNKYSITNFPRIIQPLLMKGRKADCTGHLGGAVVGFTTAIIMSMLASNKKVGNGKHSSKTGRKNRRACKPLQILRRFSYSNLAKLAAYIVIVGVLVQFSYNTILYSLKVVKLIRTSDAYADAVFGLIGDNEVRELFVSFI